MNLSEFQVCAERTMLADQPVNDKMLNAALGICGESAEVANANEYDPSQLIPESGDLLWYVAQMCNAHNSSIADFAPNEQGWGEDRALEMLWHHSGYVADAIKKLVFHQRPIVTIVFFDSLQQIVTAVDALLQMRGSHIGVACAYNYQKLLKRHPNGYSHTTANARADEGPAHETA